MRGAWLLVCVGCNEFYGLEPTKLRPGSGADLDFDGITDDEDPCIASASDAEEDSDNDGTTNAKDSCPSDPGGTDGDGDGIVDACDPFPAMPGDRRRCTMTFVNADLNRQFWLQHGGNGDEWEHSNGHLESRPQASSSVVPNFDLDSAPSSTLDARVFASPHTDAQKRFKIWLRTADATQTNVACEMAGDTTSSLLSITGNGKIYASQSMIPWPAGNEFRMIATRTMAGDVRCTVTRNGVPTIVRANVPLGAGRFGFYFDSGPSDASIRVETLAIYERDEVITP
jgi:hypothetical protein